VEVGVPRWRSEHLGGYHTEDIAGDRRALVVGGSVRGRSTLVDGAVSTAEIVNAGRRERSSTLVDLNEREGTFDVCGRCSVDGRDRRQWIRGSVRERSASVDGALSTAGTVNAGEETVNHVALRELEVD